MKKQETVYETAGQCAECGRLDNFYADDKFEIEEQFFSRFQDSFGDVKRFEMGESIEFKVGNRITVVTIKFNSKCSRCDPI